LLFLLGGRLKHGLVVLGLDLFDAWSDSITKHLDSKLLNNSESIFIGRFILKHLSEKNERCLLHYQEGAADSVHLPGIGVALPLDP
jgi:hypothetical protein